MWSRLEGTPIWNKARATYADPAGRHYHNFDHVLRLYEIAAEKGLTYSLALDLAILTHDVIWDEHPDKERRSADWLLANAEGVRPEVLRHAVDLVMSTTRHQPGGDDRLVLLDIHDLQDLDLSIVNRELLMREAAEITGTSREKYLAGNAAFFAKMLSDIGGNLDRADAGDRGSWKAIACGIKALLASEPAPPPSEQLVA